MLLAADGGEEVLLGTAVSALAAPTTSIVSGETGQLRLALVGEGDPGLEEWTTRRGSRPPLPINGEDGVDGRRIDWRGGWRRRPPEGRGGEAGRAYTARLGDLHRQSFRTPATLITGSHDTMMWLDVELGGQSASPSARACSWASVGTVRPTSAPRFGRRARRPAPRWRRSRQVTTPEAHHPPAKSGQTEVLFPADQVGRTGRSCFGTKSVPRRAPPTVAELDLPRSAASQGARRRP